MLNMYAIEVEQTGGPEVLSYVEKPQPFARARRSFDQSRGNRREFRRHLFRSGSYPHESPFILGAEVAGTVAAVGKGVTSLRLGDKIATADAVDAYAAYCFAPADVVASVPDAVSADVAAAAILKGMTAHLLIKSVYPVQSGDTVLLRRGGRRGGFDPDAMGEQPRGPSHHDGLHRAQGAALARRRRS
jgi:NADPH2:quinone reductase